MKSQELSKLKLPDSPGVYFFKRGKDILYIGKATSLRSRVRSYFGRNLLDARGPLVSEMVSKADEITFTETDSVLEALLLEAELIKKFQPRYNTDEKDDKSFSYVVITSEEFPQVLLVRGKEIDFKKLREIADACGALLMIDMSHIAGLVAGKAYPSPFLHADVVTTTTHKTLRGPRSALIFSKIDSRELNKKIDKAVFPGMQGGPHMNQIAAVAVALKEASTPAFKKYATQIKKNAKVMAEELKNRGWRIISGGTDSHLILVDTWMEGKGISGKEASDRLEKEGIIVNKNAIPFDTRPPVDPSGIRIGTAAETTRGKKEKDMKKIAERIDKILRK